MRHATAAGLLALLASGSAAAQDARSYPAPVAAVAQVEALLTYAAPCFPRDGRGREIERLLAESLAIVRQHPDYDAARQQAMLRVMTQQRYIPRSDPHTCTQILEGLRYFLWTQRPCP